LSVSIDSDGGQSTSTKSYGQRELQALLAALDVHQFDLGAGQLAVGPEHVEAALLAAHARFGHRGGFQQHVVDGQFQLALVDARAHGRIALRIQVHHQDALADLREPGRQVDGGRRLADAALLVGHTENLCHGQREIASLMPKPRRQMPATFCRTRPMTGLARIRSAR
jgi:hypothetical protein